VKISRPLQVLLLSPLGLFLVGAVLVPAAILFGYSLFTWRLVEPTGALTAANYVAVLADPLYRQLLVNTIVIALPTTIGSVVGGYTLAYYIVFGNGPGRRLTLGLVVSALMASYLVRIFAWRTLLGSNGVINSLLVQTGIIREPLGFLLFSPASAILAEVALLMPLAGLAFYASLAGISASYREASRDLGAGRAQTLLKITIPLTGASILATSALTFFLSAGDYITPVLVGGASSATLGTVIASSMGHAGNYGLGASVAFLLLVGFAVVYVLLRAAMRASRLLPDRMA
jgi:spermidine/putrescine transport system permease protein